MRHEPGLIRLFSSADVYPLIRPIMMGTIRCPAVPKENTERGPSLSQVFEQIHGACMTCTAMSGNGARTGLENILQVLLPIQPVHRAVLAGWYAAAAGSTTPGSVGQRIGTATRPAAGTPNWASAS